MSPSYPIALMLRCDRNSLTSVSHVFINLIYLEGLSSNCFVRAVTELISFLSGCEAPGATLQQIHSLHSSFIFTFPLRSASVVFPTLVIEKQGKI